MQTKNKQYWNNITERACKMRILLVFSPPHLHSLARCFGCRLIRHDKWQINSSFFYFLHRTFSRYQNGSMARERERYDDYYGSAYQISMIHIAMVHIHWCHRPFRIIKKMSYFPLFFSFFSLFFFLLCMQASIIIIGNMLILFPSAHPSHQKSRPRNGNKFNLHTSLRFPYSFFSFFFFFHSCSQRMKTN